MKKKQEDTYARNSGEITGMKQHRHNGCSLVYTSAEKVNKSLHNSETFITKTKDRCEANIVTDKHNILMEKEDNQTIKSLQFCYLKEQFTCGLDDEGMQTKIMNEIKDKSKTDNVTSKQVLMLAKQEEIHMIQLRGAGQTNAEAGQTNAEMIRAGTCKYCGSSHPPRRCPAYGMICGECS